MSAPENLTGLANLAGKTVLVIGGSSGFGLQVAKIATQDNARLVVVGRDADKAAKVASELAASGGVVEGHGLDVTDGEALSVLLDRLGGIDHLVSMVGGAMGGGFLSAPVATIRATIEEKFFASMGIARIAAPFVRPGGSMAFTAGSGGRPHQASGAIVGNEAIATLVRGLAVELAPDIRVNAVAPTWTPTPLWRSVDRDEVEATRRQFAGQIPLRRTAEPHEIAEAYLFLMKCGFITGQTIVVDGGLTLVT